MIASVGTMKKIRFELLNVEVKKIKDELVDIEEGITKPQDDAKNRCLDKIFESLALVEYHRRKMEDHRRKMEMSREESNVRTLHMCCFLFVDLECRMTLTWAWLRPIKGQQRDFEQWLLVNRDATCQEVEEEDESKVETKD